MFLVYFCLTCSSLRSPGSSLTASVWKYFNVSFVCCQSVMSTCLLPISVFLLSCFTFFWFHLTSRSGFLPRSVVKGVLQFSWLPYVFLHVGSILTTQILMENLEHNSKVLPFLGSSSSINISVNFFFFFLKWLFRFSFISQNYISMQVNMYHISVSDYKKEGK